MKQELSPLMPKEWLISDMRGFSLIEVILATATLALISTMLAGVYFYGQESTVLAGNRARAIFLAEEGIEVVRNIRDNDFVNIADGTYGLAQVGNEWVFSGSSDINDIYTRSITISTVDTDRKNIDSHVTWQQNIHRAGSVSLATRLAYWMRVVSPVGDWSLATTTASLDLAGNDNGTKVQISGDYAYIVRSGGTDFVAIDITTSSVVGSLSLAGTLANIFVSGDYAYVTSNDNAAELSIVDISNPSSPSVIGVYNDAGNDDARGVFVSGSFAYLALNGGNDLVVVDVSVPSAPVFVGGLALNGGAYEVVVSGGYAYVASSDNAQELQVVDVTTPASPALSGSLDLSGNSDAVTVTLAGSTAYVGQGTILTVVDVSAPGTPVFSGSLGASGTVQDIAVELGNGGEYLYLVTTANNAEFQVVDVSVPATPVLLGLIDTPGNDDLNGVAYDSIADLSVGVGSANAQEVFIFEPQ